MEDQLIMEAIHRNYIKTREINRIKREKEYAKKHKLKRLLNKIDEFFEDMEGTVFEGLFMEISLFLFMGGLAALLIALNAILF